jgi:uncharacterized phage-associated protein
MLDREKALNVLLYVAQQRGKIDKMGLFKSVYFAERHHLVNYGTPMLGDEFTRMDNGPVPSLICDMVKAVQGILKGQITEKEVPALKDGFNVAAGYLIIPKKAPDMDFFSKSDLESLTYGLAETKGLSFKEISDKSHDSAWEQTNQNRPIPVLDIAKAGGADEHYLAYLAEVLEAEQAFR